jgi:hypothetical protein
MKNLLIHPGLGKCGSTYIQKLLSLNSSAFKKYNIKFAESGRVKNANHFLSANYCRLSNALNERQRHLNDLKNEIMLSPDNSTTIISSEYIAGDSENELMDLYSLSDNAKITVVIYLRRQDRLVESWYAQEIKNGNRMDQPIQLFLDELWSLGLINYEGLFNKFNLPKYNIHLHLYSLEKLMSSSEDIFINLLNHIDGSAKIFNELVKTTNIEDKNIRLSLESIFLLRHLFKIYGKSIFEMFMTSPPPWYPLDGKTQYLETFERKLIMSQAKPSNDKLLKMYPLVAFDPIDELAEKKYSLGNVCDRERYTLQEFIPKAIDWITNGCELNSYDETSNKNKKILKVLCNTYKKIMRFPFL